MPDTSFAFPSQIPFYPTSPYISSGIELEQDTRTKILKATGFAIAAAVLYAMSTPLSKVLLDDVSPRMMASMLYLGAGIGLLLVSVTKRTLGHRSGEVPLDRSDLPYTVAMIVLDIAAPILLMTGLTMTSSATTSLLNNFEIVATTVIALVFFRERVSGTLWTAIALVTVSSILLSVDDISGFVLSPGAILVLGACFCWGLENNCTRKLSDKDPVQITTVKGLFSGLGSLAVAMYLGDPVPAMGLICITLVLGFLSYGLSITTYIRAQRDLGASRVSAYYSLAPFIGVAMAFALFSDPLGWSFWIALILMLIGTVLVTKDALGTEAS